ncbi:hypothetical protein SLEP1_g4202 [Rubroshorea leprosula]|uniref:Syringolide-induced protein 14-1-1 n=1 Tax=Rubroshorea leprosula TaxID=152421 RepID=A0AAV5HVJ5_9ROSI|nr:hypothetical protein SLEP1_g4202 [Rubroshorea leprosula]
MEKQGKRKSMILKFLPKVASAVTFQNPPFSPGRDKRFSGPIVSIIPDEARRKTSNNESYETPEPTSPKISCMGQIKHKKKICKSKREMAVREGLELKKAASSPKEKKKHSSAIRGMFTSSKPATKSDENKKSLSDKAPSLGQMKQFASSRVAFAEFDWKADQITQVEEDHHRNYYSDEEGGRGSDGEEEEVIIPFSAPIMVGGGVPLQPRKEINLWKRRTMNPPRPLQLNSMVGAK